MNQGTRFQFEMYREPSREYRWMLYRLLPRNRFRVRMASLSVGAAGSLDLARYTVALAREAVPGDGWMSPRGLISIVELRIEPNNAVTREDGAVNALPEMADMYSRLLLADLIELLERDARVYHVLGAERSEILLRWYRAVTEAWAL